MKRFNVEWQSGSIDYDPEGELISVKDVQKAIINYIDNGGSPSFAKLILQELEMYDKNLTSIKKI